MSEVESGETQAAIQNKLNKIMKEFGIDRATLAKIVEKLPNPETSGNNADDITVKGESSSLETEGQNSVTEISKELADQIKSGSEPTAINKLKDKLTELNESELASYIVDWTIWMSSNLKTLESLNLVELTDKIKLWQRALDFYLETDPQIALFSRVRNKDIINQLAPLVETFKQQQQRIKDFLKNQRIVRINAIEESGLIAGRIEISDQDMDKGINFVNARILSIDPGEGGYMIINSNGEFQKVICPSSARIYDGSK